MSGFPLYSVVEESRCRLSEGGSGTCPFLDLFSFFNPGDSHTHRSAIVQLKPLYAWRSRAAGVYQPSNTASNHTNTHACMFAHRCAKLSDAQTRNSRPLLSAVCASTSSLLYACRPRASAGSPAVGKPLSTTTSGSGQFSPRHRAHRHLHMKVESVTSERI